MYLERRTRYPGIKPFKTDERALFFGRERDTEEFFKLLYVQPMVVLYGRSGYGKSSLLNAGIVPKLMEAGLPHFTIRFGNYNKEDATRLLPPVGTASEPFRFDAANGQAVSTTFLDQFLPGENSLWYWIKSYQVHTGTHRLVLIFDQFEELFSYPPDQIVDFKRQLADVLYRTVPEKFLEQDESLQTLTEEQAAKLYQKADVKVAFSIRADRLSLLNDLKDFHPTILRHCFELDALDKAEARAAIVQPALLPQGEGGYESPSFAYDPPLLDEILTQICNQQDGKIETANLQIVCSYFEKFVVPSVEKERGAHEKPLLLNASDLHQSAAIWYHYMESNHFTYEEAKQHIDEAYRYDGIEGIFRNFYDRTLQELSPEQRDIAERVIEEELVKDGQRIPFALEYLLSRFDGEGLTEDLLNQLAAASLLRVERDSQGRMIYELAHDTLVKPVSEAAERRAEAKRRAAETERQRQETERAEALEKQVVNERQRAEEMTRLRNAAVKARLYAEKRRTLALRLIGVIIGVAIVTGILLWYAINSYQKANALNEAMGFKNKVKYVWLYDNKLKAFFVIDRNGKRRTNRGYVDPQPIDDSLELVIAKLPTGTYRLIDLHRFPQRELMRFDAYYTTNLRNGGVYLIVRDEKIQLIHRNGSPYSSPYTRMQLTHLAGGRIPVGNEKMGLIQVSNSATQATELVKPLFERIGHPQASFFPANDEKGNTALYNLSGKKLLGNFKYFEEFGPSWLIVQEQNDRFRLVIAPTEKGLSEPFFSVLRGEGRKPMIGNDRLMVLKEPNRPAYLHRSGKLALLDQHPYSFVSEFSEGTALVRYKNGSSAWVDTMGYTKPAAFYRTITLFRYGLASVIAPDGSARLVGKTNQVRFALRPDEGQITSFSDHLVAIRRTSGAAELVDLKTRNVLSPATCERAVVIGRNAALILARDSVFSFDYSRKTLVRLPGVMLPQWNPVTSDYGDFLRSLQISEGLIALPRRTGLEKKFGYLSPTGQLIIPFDYDEAQPFSQGVALVRKNGLDYYINHKNQMVIVPEKPYHPPSP